ncbi:MAG: enoyl-CoA hydratase/isomerase family protein [Vulcanimicrobiota bacterium]
MIITEQHGELALLTFDDGKVNLLNEDSLGRLAQALDENRGSRALILTGGGKCFSAGLDLKRMPTLSPQELENLLDLFYSVLKKILDYPCPVVAVLNGHAIAGGAVLSLCCDVTIGIQQEIKVGLSEVSVGMPLPSFVVELARQRLDPKRLVEAVLFGRLYSWEEALQVGFLHHSAPESALMPMALKIAEQLAELPREAYQQTKRLLWSKLPDTLGAEAVGSFLTEQARQHMSGFKDK